MAVPKGPEYTLWLELPAFTMQCKTMGLYIDFPPSWAHFEKVFFIALQTNQCKPTGAQKF